MWFSPRASKVGQAALLTGGSLLATLALTAPAQASAPSCDLVAAPGGSDSAPGTLAAPMRTAQALVSRLQGGQTGCLRAGDYGSDAEVSITTANVTLTSYPGERATLHTRLWVEKTGDGVTISDLNLDGQNATDLPSPTINASDVVLRGNDITNHHTAICVSLGSADTWGRAERTLIEDNRIHGCGQMPATNQDHGIYVNSSDDAVIRNNFIYDNADRGIQLYPDAQRTLVTGNVIDSNGQGVIFGGSEESASNDNVVENNVITNSKVRDNIDASWGGQVGSGNVARNNCVGGGPYDEGDGGILDGVSRTGFTSSSNLIEVPAFANAAQGDFTIPASSPCAAILAGTRVPEAVTIDASKRQVDAAEPVKVSGSADGADSVTILARAGGKWHSVGRVRTKKNGEYSTLVKLRHPGRQTLKAVAGGLKDSKALRLRVEGSHRAGRRSH